MLVDIYNNKQKIQINGGRLLEQVKPFGISYFAFGFSENVQNISTFGLSVRRGNDFSFMPKKLHKISSDSGLQWSHSARIHYAWFEQGDFLWSDQEYWDKFSQFSNLSVEKAWHLCNLDVGVSISLRTKVGSHHEIGSVYALAAENMESFDFHQLYLCNRKKIYQAVSDFDEYFRRDCLPSYYRLSSSESEVLDLYQRLGDVIRIADHRSTTPRAVQLILQKIRAKLGVETNIEAINFCRAFNIV